MCEIRMGKFIPDLISILTPTQKKKERHDFSAKIKGEVVHKQKGRCGICGRHVNSWERDFHHKDGNKSNNNSSNCQAVHTKCHRKKHAEKMSTKQHGLFFKLTQRKALLALLVALAGAICLGGTGIVLADPLHCDRGGYPSCNSVGYANGWRQGVSDRNNQLDHNSSCPSGHSENFCAGYRDGY